jgi:soluble lytic murein transglycosylase-like protein
MAERRGLALLACTACLLVAAPAGAELVYFASGQSLSVKGHREEGSRTVLVLRSGGEIVCDSSLIDRFAPDEIPHPEAAAPQTDDAARAALESMYADLIDRVSAAQGVDARLVRAVIQVESAYRSDAVSRKGAKGLMQLMPDTAQRYSVRDPFDPESNIVAGILHLRSLLDRFDVALALAAYNAGEAAVERFGGIPPYQETRDYVRRVLNLAGLAPSS